MLLGAILILISYVFDHLQNNQISQIVPIAPISRISPTPFVLSASDSAKFVKVIRVIDGDTIEIEGGQKIRYIGINAPESVAPGKPLGCYGRESSAKNKELVEGKMVKLEKDVSETDKYNRLLRYVYVENPELVSGSLFVNDSLVREGFARVSTYPPDVKYQKMFLESEKYARQNNLGLWGKCQ